MMTPRWLTEEELMPALQELGGKLTRLEKGSWRLTPHHPPGLEVEIRQSSQSGILFRAPLSRPRSLWTLLNSNRGLSGTARFALPPGEVFPLLLAEIPLEAGRAWTAWGRASLIGFQQAISRIDERGKVGSAGNREDRWRPGGSSGYGENYNHEHGSKDGMESPPPTASRGPTPGAARETRASGQRNDRGAAAGERGNDPVESEGVFLGRLCEEAGWPATPRDDGSVSINLTTPPDAPPCRAELRRIQDFGSRIQAQVAEVATPVRDARRALGHLLMSATGSVRLARATVERTNRRARISFEVGLPWPPTVAEIDHASAALSVAGSLCGREAEALQDPELASLYLKMRGRASHPTHHPACRSHQQRRNEQWLLPQPVN